VARSLIVTRPAAQAADWVRQLHALGQPAQALPLIGVQALADTSHLVAAWERLASLAMVIFVSPNAVQHFFAARPLAAGSAWPKAVLAGSTGPGTSAALRRAGVPESSLLEPNAQTLVFDSEALWLTLQAWPWAGARVAVVRGEVGRDWLAERLRGQGAQLEFITAYQRLPARLTEPEAALLQAAIANPGAYVWLFSSSQAVLELQRLAPAANWQHSRAVASHPRIVQAAQDAGFGWVGTSPPLPTAVLALLAQPVPGADPSIQFAAT
jgi:uroporphyrinogen-III synthase